MGMPPQTFDVRGNVPVAVAASPLPEPLTVLNMAVETVIYLSGEPGNKGFPLSPGSTMTWDSGQRLYITCDDGSVARIGVVYNGGQIIDSRALAQQIVSAGLAEEIATKISLAGVPTIDRPKIIADINQASTPSGGNAIVEGYDVTGYATLTGSVYTASIANTIYEIIVTQYLDSTLDAATATETRYTFMAGEIKLDIPLTGNFIDVYLQSVSGVSRPEGWSANFSVTYRERPEKVAAIPSQWYNVANYPTAASMSSTNAMIEITTGSTNFHYPWWRSGPFRMSWHYYAQLDADNNTAGITVLYGSGAYASVSVNKGAGQIGTTHHTSSTFGALLTYEGFNGREMPRLVLINRNANPIRININFQSLV